MIWRDYAAAFEARPLTPPSLTLGTNTDPAQFRIPGGVRMVLKAALHLPDVVVQQLLELLELLGRPGRCEALRLGGESRRKTSTGPDTVCCNRPRHVVTSVRWAGCAGVRRHPRVAGAPSCGRHARGPCRHPSAGCKCFSECASQMNQERGIWHREARFQHQEFANKHIIKALRAFCGEGDPPPTPALYAPPSSSPSPISALPSHPAEARKQPAARDAFVSPAAE